MAEILVIEDEREIRELICIHLRRKAHNVHEAESAEQARQIISSEKCNLAVVDWMLPGENGFDLIKSLRNSNGNNIAILMVTARAGAADIIDALEAGADDYIVKPFHPGILMARIGALLRRQSGQSGQSGQAGELAEDVAKPQTIVAGPISLDLEKFETHCGGEQIQLTLSEFKLLRCMIANRGRVLTRKMLISEIQGDDVNVIGRSIDTHVFGLRKKLGSSGEMVETIRGIGYRIKPA